MVKIRWHVVPIILVSCGVFSGWGMTYIMAPALGLWQWFFYGAGFVSLSSIFWLKKVMSKSEQILDSQRRELEAGEKMLAEKNAELEDRFFQLQRRQQALNQELLKYHEFSDFSKEHEHLEFDDQKVSTLDKQDKEVLQLLEKESQYIFDRIKGNKYHRDDKFQRSLLLNDIYELIAGVARIYKPDSENPLLETSTEQLLRAINRISLQTIILLETVPLNIKEYNLKDTYEYIRTGQKVYGVYKKVEPILPYVEPFYHIGNIARGANPLYFIIGKLAKIGAKKVSSHLANQFAKNLIHNIVLIIGGEVAGIYGGDYRHREMNWIYGAELTELVNHFQVPGDTRIMAMKELSTLSLRSEYDRVFLYRCFAANESAHPDKFKARAFLSPKERESISEQLKTFIADHIPERKDNVFLAWKTSVEENLGVTLDIKSELKTQAEETLIGTGLHSLASFLLDIKGSLPEELAELLGKTSLAARLNPELRDLKLQNFGHYPPTPHIFYWHDLGLSHDILAQYLEDLLLLQVHVFPHDKGEDVVSRVMEDLGTEKKWKDWQKKLDHRYSAFLTADFDSSSPIKKVKPLIARILLTYLPRHEILLFLYQSITIDPPDTCQALKISSPEKIWLLGTKQRLLLVTIDLTEKTDSQLTLLWTADKSEHTVSVERLHQRITDKLALSGGRWLTETDVELLETKIILSGQVTSKFNNYFRPLLDFRTPHAEEQNSVN